MSKKENRWKGATNSHGSTEGSKQQNIKYEYFSMISLISSSYQHFWVDGEIFYLNYQRIRGYSEGCSSLTETGGFSKSGIKGKCMKHNKDQSSPFDGC